MPPPPADPRRDATPPADRSAPSGATRSRPTSPSSDSPSPDSSDAKAAAPSLTRVVGENLKRLRTTRGLSLERLSKASGVSRAMLHQVELGRSTPTINVLWKIARALSVPFSALITDEAESRPTVLRASTSKVLASHDGSFLSRALFPFGAARSVEFYELRLAAHSVEKADAHPPGTKENLVVTDGTLEMIVGGVRHHLGPGDVILFDADVPHEYRNDEPAPARMFLVMTYDSGEGR